MVIAYYYNTWDNGNIRVQIEEIEEGCDRLEIHDALSAYLALKGISVHEWAIEVISYDQVIDKSIDAVMLRRGARLIREQNE